MPELRAAMLKLLRNAQAKRTSYWLRPVQIFTSPNGVGDLVRSHAARRCRDAAATVPFA